MYGVSVCVIGVAVGGWEVEAALALPVSCCDEAGDDRGGVIGSAARGKGVSG